jgi:hypothetical protein
MDLRGAVGIAADPTFEGAQLDQPPHVLGVDLGLVPIQLHVELDVQVGVTVLRQPPQRGAQAQVVQYPGPKIDDQLPDLLGRGAGQLLEVGHLS